MRMMKTKMEKKHALHFRIKRFRKRIQPHLLRLSPAKLIPISPLRMRRPMMIAVSTAMLAKT